MKTDNKKRHGFTLMEVLAAIAVMAIVLPGVMYGISLATNLASLSRRKSEATTLAQTKLNELLITGDWQTGTGAGDFGDDGPGYKWNMVVNGWDDPAATTLEQLELHVTWIQRGDQHEVVLTTLVNTSSTTGLNTNLPTGGF